MKGCALQTASFMPRLQRLIDAADGPALVVRTSGECLAANAAARPLCEALRRRDPELRGLILSATAGGTVTGRVVLNGDSEDRRAFEICVVPEDSDLFLLVARDVTMEDNLTHALLRSRDLYKDLMACSADFGWETDAAGVFTYISPGGALGYSPRELFGQLSQAILGLGEHADDNVFSTRQAQRGARIWVRARDGTRVLLVVSAVPVHDKNGEWIGARGVARDITRDHEREATLRLDQASQALMGRIIVAIRSEADPEDILRAAAQSAAQALRAQAAVILARRSKEKTTITAPLAESADLDRIARDALTASDADAEEEVSVGLDAGERQCLTTCIAASAELRAAIVFARDVATEPWRAHEIELVHGMAGHLSIALKQAEILERLEALSRHDDLTGLLNRRALMAELADRLAQARRHGRRGCLLLIDLDHFKALNDS
ncbi:MAG: diguanylate cyclase, partial [Alphaproteobacteria bacterium]